MSLTFHASPSELSLAFLHTLRVSNLDVGQPTCVTAAQGHAHSRWSALWSAAVEPSAFRPGSMKELDPADRFIDILLKSVTKVSLH